MTRAHDGAEPGPVGGGRGHVLAPPGQSLALGGLGVMLTAWCVRATSEINLLPGWESNPLMTFAPVVGLGPTGSIVCDAAACAGAAVMLLSVRGQGGERGWWVAAAVLTPLLVVIMHVLVGRSGAGGPTPEAHARIGAAWVSAAMGALAVWRIVRAERLGGVGLAARGMVLATFVGVLWAMVLRGGQQVFVEHGALVASFRADPARFLAAQGWTPGSPMALAFERRLSQPDATGWFGLSNVLASYAACAAVIGVGMLAGVALGRRKGVRVAAGGGAALAAGAGGLVLADSRGGVVAFGVGVLVYAALRLAGRFGGLRERARLCGMLIGFGCVLGPIAAVAARGVLGERLAELSLWFRWFYLEGAARISAAHPWLGVGPGGFQGAYAAAKNPLSPEEVVSPHSIGFDWAATLGVAGLAWFVLLLAAAAAIAGSGVRCDAAGQPDRNRVEHAGGRAGVRVVMLIAAVSVIGSVWLASGLLTPMDALVRLAGLACWLGAGWMVFRGVMKDERAWRAPAAAGALALLAHAQVEVTLSWPASAGLCAAVIACASGTAGGGAGWVRGAGAAGAKVSATVEVVAAAAAALCLMVAAVRAWAWEGPMREAAAVVRPIGLIAQRLGALAEGGGGTGETAEAIAEDLRAEMQRVGVRVPTPAELRLSPGQWGGWERAIADLDQALIPVAIERMLAGAPAGRPHPVWQVRREASGLCVRLAEGARLRGDGAEERRCLEEARRVLAPAGEREHRPAALWHALGMVLVRSAERIAVKRAVLLDGAREAFMAAQRGDPHNPTIALGLMRVEGARGDAEAAAAAARRVLAIDGQMRLDATRQLGASDRSEAEAVAAGAP